MALFSDSDKWPRGSWPWWSQKLGDVARLFGVDDRCNFLDRRFQRFTRRLGDTFAPRNARASRLGCIYADRRAKRPKYLLKTGTAVMVHDGRVTPFVQGNPGTPCIIASDVGMSEFLHWYRGGKL